MTRLHARGWIVGAATLLALSTAVGALAQGDDARIYSGEPVGSGVTVKPWGSGDVKDTDEAVFTGVKSLRIATQGLFQGGRIILANPANLKAAAADPNTYLKAVIKTSTTKSEGLGGYGPMGGAGMTGPGGAGKPGGMGGQGRRGGMGGGLDGGMGGYGNSNSSVLKPKPLRYVRIALVTTDGKRFESLMDTQASPGNREGWVTLSTPVAQIPGLQNSSCAIAEIQVFGDSPTVLYVGQIATVHDETPIRVDELSEQTVAVNDTITFDANADGGVSPLKYEWTVLRPGEKIDGTLPVDAEGKSFKHQFRKKCEPGQNYTVILTVSDVYGLKKPTQIRTKITTTI